MFAKLQVECTGGLSVHKPSYSLLAISYLMYVKAHYTRVHCACSVPLVHCACSVPLVHNLWTSFWSIWIGLQPRATLLLQVHTANQILPVFEQTQRENCTQFGCDFTFKFVFTNCAPDFIIKNYVYPMFTSTMVCCMFVEN